MRRNHPTRAPGFDSDGTGFQYGAVRTGLALLLALVIGCDRSAPSLRIRHQPLARVAPGYRPGGFAVADDGRRWAYRVQTSDAVTLFASDAPPLRLPAAFPPHFGPRGRLLFSWIFEPGSHHPILLMGDRRIPTGFARQGTLSFSADGTRWAVVGAPGSATPPPGPDVPLEVLVDGTSAGRFADVSVPTFSPDAKHVAWLVDEGPRAVALMVDGAVQRRFADPDGGITPRRRRNGITPMLPRQCALQYLPDGRLLWLAAHERGWTIGRDRDTLAVYAGNVGAEDTADADAPAPLSDVATIHPGTIVVPRAASAAVWWERPAGPQTSWRVVRDAQPVDGVVCAEAWPQAPVVSDDGVRVAYPCRTRERATHPDVLPVDVIAAGRRHGPYGNVWGITLAATGDVAAWAAQPPDASGDWRFYRDGRAIGAPVARPLTIAIDDAGHVGWAGIVGEQQIIGVDDTTITAGDEVVFGPERTGPTTISWVLRRGRRVVRIDATFAAQP